MTCQSEKGAALLEVLIAVAITAMMAATLAQATRFGLTVIERVQTSSAGSTDTLIARRRIATLLSRMDPEKSDSDSAQGDADSFEWYGPAPEGDGWRSGVWRLQVTDGASNLSYCEAFGQPSTCKVEETINLPGPYAFAAADGVFTDIWPAGPPPHLIRLGDLVISPRVLGASR